MKRDVFKSGGLSMIKAGILPLLFTVVVAALIMYGLKQTEESSKAEGLRILQESLTRAAVTCYAVEGNYPPSLSHIEAFYGVYIDKVKYAVHYNIMYSNVMPMITVIERKVSAEGFLSGS